MCTGSDLPADQANSDAPRVAVNVVKTPETPRADAVTPNLNDPNNQEAIAQARLRNRMLDGVQQFFTSTASAGGRSQLDWRNIKTPVAASPVDVASPDPVDDTSNPINDRQNPAPPSGPKGPTGKGWWKAASQDPVEQRAARLRAFYGL